jgi:hypothetical protein
MREREIKLEDIRARAAAEEAELDVQVQAEMELGDAQSLAAGGSDVASVRGTQPPQSVGEAADIETLLKQLDETETKRALLTRILRAKQAQTAQAGEGTTPDVKPHVKHNIKQEFDEKPLISATSPSSPSPGGVFPVARSSDYADISLRKVDRPKPWTGEFSYRKREIWIKTAIGYLSSLGLNINSGLNEEVMPQAFYALRTLFSTEAKAGTPSPSEWFEGRNEAEPFTRLSEVFDSMRAHWVDDGAAELALKRFRAVSQGVLRVRDYATVVTALANDVFDRTITDEDRASTFLSGLNADAQAFYHGVRVNRMAATGVNPRWSFVDTIKIASQFDTLPKIAAPSPLHTAPRRTTVTNAAILPPPQPPVRSSWVDNARSWQLKYPVKDRKEWFRQDSKPTTSSIRCYNCTKEGHHYSTGCPNSRQDPGVVVIAALSRLSPLLPSSTPSLLESEDMWTESEQEGKANGG